MRLQALTTCTCNCTGYNRELQGRLIGEAVLTQEQPQVKEETKPAVKVEIAPEVSFKLEDERKPMVKCETSELSVLTESQSPRKRMNYDDDTSDVEITFEFSPSKRRRAEYLNLGPGSRSVPIEIL